MSQQDVQELKARCAGQWSEIIASLCTIDPSVLNGKHHSCPKCLQGTDCFNLDRNGTGGAFCNKCQPGTGDGIETIIWLNGWTFARTIDEINRWLHPVVLVADDVAKLRHKIYTKLASMFPLSDQHRQQLRDRRLTDAEIDRRGYWSAPAATTTKLLMISRAERDDIGSKVPGVCPGGAPLLSMRNALMIPVRNVAGQIVGVQCRPDRAKDAKGPKYCWFSSAERGLSPGAPAHTSIDSASRQPKKGVVRLTEGPLKGDIAETLSAVKTIAIAGVGNWKAAIKPIESIKPEFVYLAFDNDSWSNPNVARAITEVYDDLKGRGYLVQLEIWPDEYKGIDDALAAGLTTTVLPIEETLKRIEQLRKVAAQRPKAERLRNYKRMPATEDARKEFVREPLPVPVIAEALLKMHDNWPKSCKGKLFVKSRDGKGIRYLKTVHELFGWIAATSPVDFSATEGCVTKAEFFSQLPDHVEQFDRAENTPHFPPIDGHYYCREFTPGDGTKLQQFIDFFSPSTEFDRELILAFIATVFWGGAPGRRVAFGIDSVTGTGAGKSELVKRIASLTGGCYEFDVKEMKEEVLRKQLVNGEDHRVALLDNIKESCLSSSTLESLITSAWVGGHQFHFGYSSRPNTMTWAITMNGMSLSRDLAQRTVVIKVTDPKRSGTWDDEVDRFLRDHRDDVVADVAAFFARPQAKLERFTRWASWEVAILSRLENPAALQKLIENRAGESDQDHKTAKSIQEYFTSKLEDLGFNPSEEKIHIPVNIAKDWLIESVGQEYTLRSARAMLKNLIDGGSLKNFGENQSRKNGRGWIWNFLSQERDVNYSLEQTFNARKKREEHFRKKEEEDF